MQCPECSCTQIRKNGKKQGKHSSDATIEELRYLLYGRIGFFVSRSTIGRMIKLLDITVKKTLFPSGKGTERVQILRGKFWKTIK